MKCRCPACGRTTRVAPDLLGFLTRCEHCRSFVLTRVSQPAGEDEPADASGAPGLSLHVVPTGRIAEAPATAGSLADLLSRPKPAKKNPPAPEPPPASDDEVWQAMTVLAAQASDSSLDTLETLAMQRSERQWRLAALPPNPLRRRRTLRTIAVVSLATAGAVLLYALAIGLEKTLLRPDSARGESLQSSPSPLPQPPQSTHADPPSALRQPAPPQPATNPPAPHNATPPAPEGRAGELFPHLGAQP